PGRVVLRVAQKAVTSDAFDVEQLTVSTRNEQRDKRKRRLRIGEQRRQQMAFEMMNAYDRLAEREAERASHRGADQQRAGKSGAFRVRDAVEVSQRRAGLGEHSLCEWHDALDMIARRKLRHD